MGKMAVNYQNKSRQFCPDSDIYDEQHRLDTNWACPFKHRMYDWPGVHGSDNLLLSDSICKYVQSMHDTHVIATPGATIDTIVDMIVSGKVKVEGYWAILLHFGSNDTFLAQPYQIAQNMSRLVDLVLLHNSHARVAVSGIIVRYKHTWIEEESRRKSNDEIAIMCRLRGIRHMKSWKCVLEKGVPIHADYAQDDIHLSRVGADKIKEYMEGTIISMKGD